MLRRLILVAGVLAMGQEFTDIRVERVAVNQKFAEGPVWSLEGYLLWSDNVTDASQKLVPGKGVTDAGKRAGGASGQTYDEQGRFYVAEFRERRVTRTAKNGKVDVIASKFEGKRLNAPNDIVVRRDNNVYFTDPAFGNQQEARELDFYGVYRADPKGALEAIARWKTRPNGITLSPNGRLLYVSDSDQRVIRMFDLGRNGEATNERVFVEKIPGIPGGLRTDDKGNVWVAARGLVVYSPKGELLHQIPLAEQPSNLTFGDADLGSLYVTARTTVYRVRMSGMKGFLPYAPASN